MKKTICLLLALTLCAALAAPALADSTPLIYRITDGEGHVVYLTGTMHMTSADCYPIAGIDAILDECDTLVLETVAGDANSQDISTLLSTFLVPEGNGLPEETLERVNAMFTEHGMGVFATMSQNLTPGGLLMFLELALITDAFGPDATSVEAYLTGLAEARGMKVAGFETGSQQVGAIGSLNAIGDEDALMGLEQTLNDPDALTAQLEESMRAWASGDLDALLATSANTAALAGSEASEESMIYDEIFGGRNDRFVQGIEELLAAGGRALVAVGCLHVVDPETGIVRQLQDAGYTVERVYAEVPAAE